MYRSPIEIIYGGIEAQIENDVLKAVHRIGVNVNKEELLKALQYDRKQYSKGYKDGLNADGWIPCSERLPEKYTHCLVTRKNEYEDGFDSDVREDVWIEVEGEWDWLSKIEGLTCEIIAWMPLPEPYKEE